MKENLLKLLNGMLSPNSQGDDYRTRTKTNEEVTCSDSNCIRFFLNIAIFTIVLKVFENNKCLYTNAQMFFGPGFTEALHATFVMHIDSLMLTSRLKIYYSSTDVTIDDEGL